MQIAENCFSVLKKTTKMLQNVDNQYITKNRVLKPI